MNQDKLRSKVRQIVEEAYKSKSSLRESVRRIVAEEYRNHVNSKRRINEEDESTMASKRKTVMKMLNDDKYSHAYLAYQLWNPKDDSEKDTYRSLFSKMVSGKPDNEGNIRKFSDADITKLYELLRKN